MARTAAPYYLESRMVIRPEEAWVVAKGTDGTPLRVRRRLAWAAAWQAEGAADTAALHMARSMGLLDGPKAKQADEPQR